MAARWNGGRPKKRLDARHAQFVRPADAHVLAGISQHDLGHAALIAAPARLFAGVEPDGECLGLPAAKQTLLQGLGHLLGHRRVLQTGLAFPDRRSRPHSLTRPAQLGVCQCLGDLVLDAAAPLPDDPT